MTNPAHYPSLELCKKLTEIGFPKTVLQQIHVPENGFDTFYIGDDNGEYVCPPVMEMLDVMPAYIEEYTLGVMRYHNGEYNISYVELAGTGELQYTEGTLPKALADMILWLHENKYISFNK